MFTNDLVAPNPCRTPRRIGGVRCAFVSDIEINTSFVIGGMRVPFTPDNELHQKSRAISPASFIAKAARRMWPEINASIFGHHV